MRHYGEAVKEAIATNISAERSPQPGDEELGDLRIETALVAGLTGVGTQAGPAVSAVLLYRLGTYWLPMLRGWLSWRSPQHRGYV
jgi:hypothetical protein